MYCFSHHLTMMLFHIHYQQKYSCLEFLEDICTEHPLTPHIHEGNIHVKNWRDM